MQYILSMLFCVANLLQPSEYVVSGYFIHRVEHRYTAGRIFLHHTCAGYIPYRPINHTVPYEACGISVTHSILITIV